MASFSIMAVLGANISGFVSGMNSAKGVASSAGASIGSSLTNHIRGKLAGIASIAGIEMAAQKIIEFGGKVTDLSGKLGISTDDVQAWDYALGLSGGSIEEASKAFTKLGISIAKANEGDKASIEHFTNLGIAVDTLRGKTAGPVMLEIAKKFKAGGGDDAAMEGAFIGVAGKSADSMFAAFRDGAGDMVEQFGSAMMGIDAETIASLDAIGDKWSSLMQKLRKDAAPLVSAGADFFSAAWEKAEGFAAWYSAVYVGIWDGIKSMSVNEHGLNPFAAAKTGMDSFRKDFNEKLTGLDLIREEEKAAAEAQKGAKAGMSPEKAAEREMTRKAASEEQSLRRAREQLELEQRKGQLASMTATQRAASLREEMEALKAKADMEADPLEKAKLQTKAQKIQNDLDSDERKSEKAGEKSAKAKPRDRNMVNSLQQIGGMLGTYVQAPEVAALDLQRRSEDHLQAIRRSMTKLASAGGFGSPDEA
jgi:pyruvate/2-oxoglutarate dehydrogenase complex dihydrolipoamide acyltransferase (E2) component